jgi:hypothetical protein
MVNSTEEVVINESIRRLRLSVERDIQSGRVILQFAPSVCDDCKRKVTDVIINQLVGSYIKELTKEN